ncbi:MAG: hypothetical protein VZR33_02530 [Methanosphaera sp.]|nr:hypothetical protein [Methanosphaera sp.]
MKYYVKINGVSSETIQGLKISELPSISKPLCRSTREEIDGRDGDIITKLGYSAYDKTLKIGLWGNYDINQVIAFFNQEGKITFSNEPDKYYIFTILNRADFINQLEAFRTASITIHCQPFKYMEQPSPEFDREYVEETGTDLTFNNSVEAPLLMDLKGNTSQNTLSGKNLFNKNDIVSGSYINEDGSIGSNANTFYCNYIKVKQNTTYTISGKNNLWTNTATYDSNKNFIARVNDSALTTGNNVYYIRTNGRLEYLNNIQIEEGSTATAYEPYCGGIPSPNPSYPQNVNVVSGDNDINIYSGDNLFNENNLIDNANINSSGTITSDNYKIYYLPVESEKSYRMTIGSSRQWVYAFYSSTPQMNSTGSSRIVHTSVVETFSVPSGYNYIAFRRYDAGGEPITNLQINEVSTYNIDLPVENLFDSDTLTFKIGYYSSRGQYLTGDNNGIMEFINVLPNTTYTISVNTSIREMVISEFNGETWIKRTPSTQPTTSLTITTGRTTNKLAIVFSKDTTTTMTKEMIVSWQPMLELGTKTNTFTPYGTTPIELNKIGTYQDYIYKEDDKWYLHKEIGKVDIYKDTNYQNIYKSGYTTKYLWGNNGIPNIKHNTTGAMNVSFCNYFTYASHTDLYNGTVAVGFSNGSDGVYFANNNCSADDMKTFMTNHQVIMYYLLETPTNTEITYQPLINQLNTIEDAESYEGSTNIYQVSNDLPFIITASVLCGAAKFIVNNIGNTIAKPVMTIEGSGNIGIYLNDIQMFTIALGDEGSITLDIANMEAYKDGILKNRLVVGDYNSFVLQPGNNTISFSGDVVECEIKNYSRWL